MTAAPLIQFLMLLARDCGVGHYERLGEGGAGLSPRQIMECLADYNLGRIDDMRTQFLHAQTAYVVNATWGGKPNLPALQPFGRKYKRRQTPAEMEAALRSWGRLTEPAAKGSGQHRLPDKAPPKTWGRQ